MDSLNNESMINAFRLVMFGTLLAGILAGSGFVIYLNGYYAASATFAVCATAMLAIIAPHADNLRVHLTADH